MKDYEVFIIWDSAKKYENRIIGLIEENFKILKIINVTWTKERFTENLTTFYETDLRLNVEQVRMRGNGTFKVVLIEDNSPIFCLRVLNRETCDVNEKVYLLKENIRKNITGASNVHASLNRSECQNNMIKLFGLTIEEMLDEKTNVLGDYVGDCLGVGGWKCLDDVFKVLNYCFEYVVLRGWENLIDKYSFEKDGDIDILVDDLPRLSMVLQPSIDRKNNYCFLNWLNVAETRIPIHAKFVGDNYYDENWQSKILLTRIWNGQIYVPNDEMLFWTLLYHGLFHKNNYLKYKKILSRIANEQGIVFSDDSNVMINVLAKWVRKSGYKCSVHLDGAETRLNEENVPKDLLCSGRKFYIFKTYLDGTPIKSMIVCNDLIKKNPVLFTEVLRNYDPLYRVEQHVLPWNNSLVCELNERAKCGEVLWQYSIKNGGISLLVYSCIENERGRFTKKILTRSSEESDTSVTFFDESAVDYYDGRTVDYWIINKLITSGYEEAYKEIKDFIWTVFDRYSENEKSLNAVTWDLLSHNCIKNGGNYHFFDFEAVFRSGINKSTFLAYEVKHLADICAFNIEPKRLYVSLCNEFNVEVRDYDVIVYDRRKNEYEISKYRDSVDYYIWRRYIDVQLGKQHPVFNESIDESLLSIKANDQWKKFFLVASIKRVVVYGLGKYGRILLAQLENEPVEVVACCDINVREYKNYKVVNNISDIPVCDAIIIAIIDGIKIKPALMNNKFTSVFTIEELVNKASYL